MSKETYMKSKEAAAYIGVCFRTLQTYIADGLIPCTKPAGRWLFKTLPFVHSDVTNHPRV